VALLHAMLMLPVEHHRRCLWLPTLLSILLSADFFWTTLRGRLDLFLVIRHYALWLTMSFVRPAYYGLRVTASLLQPLVVAGLTFLLPASGG